MAIEHKELFFIRVFSPLAKVMKNGITSLKVRRSFSANDDLKKEFVLPVSTKPSVTSSLILSEILIAFISTGVSWIAHTEWLLELFFVTWFSLFF